MKQLSQHVVQIGCFMICAQVLIHFRPDGSYEKYLKFLVSIMILVQIFTPVLERLGGGWDPGQAIASFEGTLVQPEQGEEELNTSAEGILDGLLLWKLEEVSETEPYTVAPVSVVIDGS